MEITKTEILELKKLVSTSGWEVYQKVLEKLKQDIKEYIPRISLTLPGKEYQRIVQNAVRLIVCLDRIDKEILSVLIDKDVKIEDILFDRLDPYAEKKEGEEKKEENNN